MGEAAIIETKSLRKVFPGQGRGKSEVVAVENLSFQVSKGEIFGFLGPNGAGKTTTMRMLSTLLSPTAGQAVIAGADIAGGPEEIRKKIGYVSQVGGLLRDATGRENLVFQGRLYGMNEKESRRRSKELIELFKLETYADRRVSTYSGGQRRIFDLACGVVHKPQLLFLDEPSTGLDPQNRAHVWDEVQKLNKAGMTIFLTTHYLEEADALCGRIAVMDKGRIMALGSPAELKEEYAAATLDEVFLKITGHILWNPETN